MAGHASGLRTIRPVSYQETDSRFRTVNDANGMGRALMEYCDPADPAYRQAAGSCIAFAEGTVTPEQVRADFIQAPASEVVSLRDGVLQRRRARRASSRTPSRSPFSASFSIWRR